MDKENGSAPVAVFRTVAMATGNVYIRIYTTSSLLCLPNSQWVHQYIVNSRNATGQWDRDKSQLLAQYSCLGEVPRLMSLQGCVCVCVRACVRVCVIPLDSDSKSFFLISFYKPMRTSEILRWKRRYSYQTLRPDVTTNMCILWKQFFANIFFSFQLVASSLLTTRRAARKPFGSAWKKCLCVDSSNFVTVQ